MWHRDMVSANAVGKMVAVDLMQRCPKTSICNEMWYMQNAMKLGKLI